MFSNVALLMSASSLLSRVTLCRWSLNSLWYCEIREGIHPRSELTILIKTPGLTFVSAFCGLTVMLAVVVWQRLVQPASSRLSNSRQPQNLPRSLQNALSVLLLIQILRFKLRQLKFLPRNWQLHLRRNGRTSRGPQNPHHRLQRRTLLQYPCQRRSLDEARYYKMYAFRLV